PGRPVRRPEARAHHGGDRAVRHQSAARVQGAARGRTPGLAQAAARRRRLPHQLVDLMANLDNVKDSALKARLTEAHTQLRAGQSTEAVHTLADAFLAMLSSRPALKEATVAGRRGPMPLVSMWPRLGADLTVEPAGP